MSAQDLPRYYIGLSYENVRGAPSCKRVPGYSSYKVKKIPFLHRPEEFENGYFFALDVTGVKPQDILLVYYGDQLLVEVEKDFNPHKVAHNAWEKAYGIFRRRFLIPTDCDAKNIYYRVEDGVLEVAMLKENGKKAGFFKKVFHKHGPQNLNI